MWWKRAIFFLVIGTINFTLSGYVNAYEVTGSKSYGESKYMEKALIYELRTKFSVVLDKAYDDYVFDNFHILPLEQSETFPPKELILEGRVTVSDGSYDVVQITFNATPLGYKVSGLHTQSQDKVAEPIAQLRTLRQPTNHNWLPSFR
ncbi:hypothetical protein [Paenibacillus harenae]|nr:hypothetical protein [Paenibacillus harenae]